MKVKLQGRRPVIRMCTICRERFPKKTLRRYALTAGNLPREDVAQRLPGRGCYICGNSSCQEKFMRRIACSKKGG